MKETVTVSTAAAMVSHFFRKGPESESLLRLAAVGTFFYLGTPQARGAGTVE